MTNPQINELTQRFSALPPKDRLALTVLGVFLAALLIIYLVLLPAHRFANEAAVHHQQRAELLAWMQANEATVKTLASQPNKKTSASSGQSILSLASQQAQAHNINFKRFEPFGDGGLRIWLDEVGFNNMLQWLTQLQQEYGVQVRQVSIDRAKKAGTVSSKLELFLP